MASNELQQSFRTRINQLHQANKEWGESIRFELLGGLNRIRECGALLEEAKNALNHTEWRNLQVELDFGHKREQVIQTYLLFIRKHPNEITDIESGQRALTDTMMVTGLLPFPEGHGPQTLHPPNLFSWMAKTVTSVTSELKKRIDASPIDSWPQEAAEQFVAQIEPMIERINGIYAQAKARASVGSSGAHT
jgi:hypothetical protein